VGKSDRTDPYALRIWGSPDRVAWHDHRFGFCDLPSTLRDQLAGGSHCEWVLNHDVEPPCPGCAYCVRGPYKRAPLRAARAKARRELRRSGPLD
jgi:hypothetical protein